MRDGASASTLLCGSHDLLLAASLEKVPRRAAGRLRLSLARRRLHRAGASARADQRNV